METIRWHEIWAVTIGSEAPIKHFPPIPSAIITYCLVNIFCYFMYRLSSIFLPSFLKIYAQDFFKTLVFCTYSFGHGLMRDYHGNLGYFIVVVPLNTITVLMFTSGEGNPLGNWTNYLKGVIPLWKFITRIIVQIAAGLSAYRLGRTIYKLDYHWSFAHQLTETECTSALTVPVYAGFLIELSGTMYDAWVGYQQLLRFKPLEIFLKFMNMAAVVCMGVYLTGMFMHPSMATGLTFGCKGTSPLEHIFVYWAGPFIGIFLALKLDKFINLRGAKKTEKESSRTDTSKENHLEEQDQWNNNLRQRKKKKYYTK